MEEVELSARTVEEAVQRALEQLGRSREEVEIEILKKGRPGFYGLGAEEAKVKVRPLVIPSKKEDDVVEIAKEVLEKILDFMGLAASVEVSRPLAEEIDTAPLPVTLNIKGEDLGILIGRQGQTLASLQHIVRLIVAHRLKAPIALAIDVESYKQRHCQALQELALRLAQKAESTGQAVTLEPMPATERRIVHLALAKHPEVITQSIGEGEARKVIIAPKTR